MKIQYKLIKKYGKFRKKNEENSKQIINDKLEGEKYKIKDIKAKILIAIAFFILFAPYAFFFSFGIAFVEGGSIIIPSLIVSLIIYLLITAILIFVHNKSKDKKILLKILGILILVQIFFSMIGFIFNGLQLLIIGNSEYHETTALDCEEIENDHKDKIYFDSAEKNRCYLRVAQREADIEICDKIDVMDELNNCYWAVSIKQNSPDYCLRAKNKEYCYIGYASKLAQEPGSEDGVDICRLITLDKELRKFCCHSVSSKGADVEKNNECMR